MKRKLYIANCDFEMTLAGAKKLPKVQKWQLEFLPLLFANAEDYVLVTHLPDSCYLDLLRSILGREVATLVQEQELHKLLDTEVIPWGHSEDIAVLCSKYGLLYNAPDSTTIKTVNSKEFSFTNSLKLPGARLVYSVDDLEQFMQQVPGDKVVKSCYGLTGKGHYFIQAGYERALPSLQQEFSLGRPCIAEPWVRRLKDFSTQWSIEKGAVSLLGVTHFEVDSFGRWRKTKVLPEALCSHVEEHSIIAAKLLNSIASMGFYGFVGVDAMVYQYGNEIKLHPVVEINARMTMSLVALLLLQSMGKYGGEITFKKGDLTNSLLPQYVETQDGLVAFSYGLYATFEKELIQRS